MSQRGQAVPTPGDSTRPISIIVPGYLISVAQDIMAAWLRIDDTFILSGATIEIRAKGDPGTSNAVFDILRSADTGASFQSLLPAGIGNKINLAPGSHAAVMAPNWTIPELGAGDLIRVDVVQIDDGTGFGYSIYVEPA